MITDNERREVTRRLRELVNLVYSADNTYELMADALGVDDFEGTDVLFDRLADIIDRPTCHISETDHEFEDSVRCDRCRTTFNRPWEPFKYCPNCGAEVVDDARL